MKNTIFRLLIIIAIATFIAGCASTSATNSGTSTSANSSDPLKFIFPPYEGTGDKPKLAVFNFSNDTPFESEVIGPGVSNTLVTSLVKSKHFRVVERSMIQKVMGEISLSLSGMTGMESAVEAGEILGADYLIMGSITEFGIKTTGTGIGYGGNINSSIGVQKGTARVVIDIRVIDPTTSEVVNVATGVGSHYSTSVGLALKELSLLKGTVGFDETLIGIATRKAANAIVLTLINEGIE